MCPSDTIPYEDSDEPAFAPGQSPYLALIFEAHHPLSAGARLSLVATDEVTIGRGAEPVRERTRDGGKGVLRLRLPDAWMSSEHAKLVKHPGGWRLIDQRSKNGTFVNGERIQSTPLSDGDLIETGSSTFLFRDRFSVAVTEPAIMTRESCGATPRALVTFQPMLRDRLALLAKIARSPVPILIQGDTGTGKEVVARAIHDLSGRSGPCLAVNCGALPPTLIESELFGAKKGAYSGATERQGLVRSADRGTLFLDEIAELPPESQATLLRVLQEGEVLPVGGTQPVKVDLRVLAATHQDLAELVAQGKFRRDLYSRLIGFELRLPRLRDRREDLGLLLAALLPRVAGDRAQRLTFHRTAARALASYDWPHNIRELEHSLRSAVALAEDDEIRLEHLPPSVQEPPPPPATPPEPELDPEAAALRDQLLELVATHHGNVSAMARAMDKERIQIRRLCKRYGIDIDSYRR